MSAKQMSEARSDSFLQYEFADSFFAELSGLVRCVVISPGSRSTPLVLTALGYPVFGGSRDGARRKDWADEQGGSGGGAGELAAAPRMKPFVVLDERSAGFVALGIAKSEPVALICTSGTAAANYLPAVVEAYHSRLPLIVITADRPASYHDWGSPQTIIQNGLYAQHVRWQTEMSVARHNPTGAGRLTALRAVENACGPPGGPVHINWPLEKPLEPPEEPVVSGDTSQASVPNSPVDSEARDTDSASHSPTSPLLSANFPNFPTPTINPDFLPPAATKGLIVVGHGDLTEREATAVAKFADKTGWPIAAEAASGMRFGSGTRNILRYAHFLFSNPQALPQLDVAIRVGGHHLDRALPRYLDSRLPEQRIVVAPPGCWDDPAFLATQFIHGDIAEVFSQASDVIPDGASDPNWLSVWQQVDEKVKDAIEVVFEDGDEVSVGEAQAVRTVVQELCERDGNQILYASSSLPIRHLEYFATPVSNGSLRILANRGANGIDGVISSACGAALQSDQPTTLLLGDLAFLHDIGGLLTVANLGANLKIVVLNNNGGAIFSQLPIATAIDAETFATFFSTPHNTDLSFVGNISGVRYHKVTTSEELREALAGSQQETISVIEIPTEANHHLKFMERCYQAASKALKS